MIIDTRGYRLINLRRDNASSQLVIITHDENFLRQLAAEDACDFFWSVQHSCQRSRPNPLTNRPWSIQASLPGPEHEQRGGATANQSGLNVYCLITGCMPTDDA
jgi:hypothetical protein